LGPWTGVMVAVVTAVPCAVALAANTAAVKDPGLLEQISRRFGSQANEVVLLDDAKVFLANEALPPDIKRAKAAG